MLNHREETLVKGFAVARACLSRGGPGIRPGKQCASGNSSSLGQKGQPGHCLSGQHNYGAGKQQAQMVRASLQSLLPEQVPDTVPCILQRFQVDLQPLVGQNQVEKIKRRGLGRGRWRLQGSLRHHTGASLWPSPLALCRLHPVTTVIPDICIALPIHTHIYLHYLTWCL